MSGCNHNCSECASHCGSRANATEYDFSAPLYKDSRIGKVIGVVSGKGGVGKSLVTSLLASAMQKKGYRTAVLDADITGPSIPKTFGLKEKALANEEGVLIPVETKDGIQVMSINLIVDDETQPVIWRGPVIAGVVKQFYSEVIWKDVDYMFVDMPPGTGDVPLTVYQSLPIDGIVIVTTPQDLVSMIVEKAVKMAERMNIEILGIVENMSYFVCPNCDEKHYIFGDSNVEELAERYAVKSVAKLPITPAIADCCDEGNAFDIDTECLEGILSVIEDK